MTMRLLLVVFLVCLAPADPAWGDEAWEREVDRQRLAQDRQFETAATGAEDQQAALAPLVRKYEGAATASRTALDMYLLGRAYFFAGRGEDSERAMQETLRLEPGFWFAHRSLARLKLAKKDYTKAEEHIQVVLRRRPQDGQVRRLLGLIALERKDPARALQIFEALRRDEPDDPELALLIADVHNSQGRHDAAAALLKDLAKVHRSNLRLLEIYGRTLAQAKHYQRAANQFERIIRLAPEAYHVLGMLEMCYVELEKWPNVKRTLERMRPLAPEDRERQRIDHLLRILEQGPPKRGAPQQGPGPNPEGPRNAVEALLMRCLDSPDADRRAALEEWHGAQIDVVPPQMLRRLNPSLERDARCRIWLVRIVGQLEIKDALPNLGVSLAADPSSKVRAVASEEIGRNPSPAAVLHLHQQIVGLRVDPVPTEPAAQRALVQEYNAARVALRRRTGFRDTPPMSSETVVLEDLADNQRRWIAYFATSVGRSALIEAIRAVPDTGDPSPQWLLWQPIVQIEHVDVLRAAYGVLRAHAAAAVKGDDATQRRLWSGFPQFEEAAITAESRAGVRDAVQQFLTSLRK
jgi:tetratricopeptide (TPR) repeat protein